MSDAAPITAPAAAASPANPGGAAPVSPGAAAVADLFEVKIDGRTEKWTRDRLIAEAQKGAASNKRFQEASELQKQANALIQALKEGGDEADAILAKFGVEDPMELFRTNFGKRLKAATMTREEREAMGRESENKRLKSELEKHKAEVEEKRIAAIRDETIQRYDAGIGEALKASQLPKNAFSIKRMCEVADTYLAQGVEPNWKVVAQVVEDEFFGGFSGSLEEMAEEKLEKLLSPKLRAKLRKLELTKLRGGKGGTKPAEGQKPPERKDGEPAKKDYMDLGDMRDYLENVKMKALKEGR